MNDISTSQCNEMQYTMYNQCTESKFIDRKYQRMKYCEEESELTIIRLRKESRIIVLNPASNKMF